MLRLPALRSTYSAASRLVSRRALLLGGVATSWLVSASDIRPLSEEAVKIGSPSPSRARPLRLLRLVRHLLHRLLWRPLVKALRAAHPARHAYPYLRDALSRVKSTPAP